MRDLLRFIPWWILAVFLAIMLVWQSRLQIAEFALSMALDGFAAKGHTIEDLDYQLESLDLSSLTFSSFNFSVDDPEQKIRVSGQQLSVSYTLENLYRGRLNEIKADSLNIQIEEPPDSKLIRVAPENYLKLMERAISTPFPIAQISVKELSLEHNGNRSQRYNPVILSISSAQNFSTVKLTHSRWQAVANTTINGDRNQISATLTSTPGDDETTELATLMMEIVAQQHNKPRAEGLLTLSLENFLQWGFKPLEKTTTITQSGESAATSPTGQIALEFAIVTDSIERNFQLDLQARSPELHYSGRSANNINLKTSIDFPEEIEYPKLGKIDIKSLNLSVEQLKTPEMLVQKLSINNHGIVTLEHKTLSATLKPQTRVEAETLDIMGIHLENVRFDPVLTLVEIENSYKIDLLKGTAFSADRLKAKEYPLLNCKPW